VGLYRTKNLLLPVPVLHHLPFACQSPMASPKTLLLLLSIAVVQASFVFKHDGGASFTVNRRKPSTSMQNVVAVASKQHRLGKITSGTCLFAQNDSEDRVTNYEYGTERGSILMAIVMAFCIWTFSIPPSFRRAHICYTQPCVEQRSACSDCVTGEEWISDVVDYYRGGGGIQWDFSIDPKTVEQNQQKWDEIFDKK
jgi:hypothetical protein